MRRARHEPVRLAAMRFALWASMRKQPPTWQEVQMFLGCTSTKARRWRRVYLQALAFPYPGPAGGRRPNQQQHPQQETTHE